MANPANVRQIPPVYDGTTILVQGHILPNAVTFAINLCAGPNYGQCDTALHINPRYNQGNAVVRNSFLNGSWGDEERGGPAFNVPAGQTIEVLMSFSHDAIRVAFNGQHYCDFHHRTAKERITYIVASGDINITNITFYGPGLGVYGGASGPVIGASTSPGSMPYQQPYQPPGGYYASPVVAFPVPSGYPAPGAGYGQPHPSMAPGKSYIPGGLFPGRLIYITLTPGPTQFAVNLRHQETGGDIALHFNPRLADSVVVRNSDIGGTWGAEERNQPSFPFVAGHAAHLILLCEADKFKIAVNNSHFIEFNHRSLNLAAIQWVEVVADASNVSIHVQ